MQQQDLFHTTNVAQQPTNIVAEAINYLTQSYKKEDLYFTNADAVKSYCQLQLAAREHEIFGVLFLDNRHRLIAFQELFRGTIDSCSVYVREVAKEALKLNAAAVIYTHNHPSGNPSPSQADQDITKRLQGALSVLDIRTLDHIVVGLEGTVSFAERGLL